MRNSTQTSLGGRFRARYTNNGMFTISEANRLALGALVAPVSFVAAGVVLSVASASLWLIVSVFLVLGIVMFVTAMTVDGWRERIVCQREQQMRQQRTSLST